LKDQVVVGEGLVKITMNIQVRLNEGNFVTRERISFSTITLLHGVSEAKYNFNLI
jgi:hypothetical protein